MLLIDELSLTALLKSERPESLPPDIFHTLQMHHDASAKYGKCPEAMIPVVPILAKRLMKVRRLEAFIFINFDS